MISVSAVGNYSSCIGHNIVSSSSIAGISAEVISVSVFILFISPVSSVSKWTK